MADSHVYIPVYGVCLIGITVFILILILIYLLHLLHRNRRNTIHAALIREPSADAARVTYKPNSFHLPLIHINKFEKIFTSAETTENNGKTESRPKDNDEEPSHSKRYGIENLKEKMHIKDINKFEKLSNSKEFKRNNIELNKENNVKPKVGYNIPEPIAIIPPDKMKDICYGVIKKAALKSKDNNAGTTYDTPNDALYKRPKMLSTTKLIEKSSSVPELEIYDDVSNQRSLKLEIFSSFDDSELTKPRMRGLKLVTDSHYGYNFPLYVELMYENANSKNN